MTATRPYLKIFATVALLALAVLLAQSNTLANAIVTAMIVAIAGHPGAYVVSDSLLAVCSGDGY